MNRDFIARHWYADIYEQFENQQYDVDFLLQVINEQTGGTPQRILEVACGGGRISIPLAQAGHHVTGFDADTYMLLRCYRRMQGLPNIRCYQADALTADWGHDYDVVILAGNILINIETDMDYAAAQKTFIDKAAKALRVGGHLYMDFDLHSDPAPYFNCLKESSYFTGTDDMGTYGRTVGYGSVYDPVTRTCAGTSHWELTTSNGEKIIVPNLWHKHIPTQAQVYGWLADAGLVLEHAFKNHTNEPVEEPVNAYCRASLWSRKA